MEIQRAPVRDSDRLDARELDSANLVSVIIPTFNRAKLVRDALDSIAVQSWDHLEIIVVDDGSTDRTSASLDAWRAAHPQIAVRVLRQTNRGPSAARNAGVETARGDFFYFLDSDDLVEPHALSTLIAPLLAGRAPFSLAHIRNTDLAGRFCGDQAEGVSRQSTVSCFGSHWMTNAALYRRATFAAAGPFNEALGRGEDTEHLWRVLNVAGPGVLIDTYIGDRRIHGQNHLCIGRSPRQCARDDIVTVARFLDWAERNGRKSDLLCRSVFLRAVIAAVRAGHARDWDCHAGAVELLDRADQRAPRPRWMLTTIVRLRWRIVHVPLMAAIAGLKWLRNTWRSHRRPPAHRRAAAPRFPPAARRLGTEA